MSKVKVMNQSLQVINILVKETKDNSSVQLLPKQEIIIDKSQLTEQIKRLSDLSMVSITPFVETITI
jgi:hypothetical protein